MPSRPQRLLSCSTPSDEAGWYKWVERAAIVPSNLWLPKFDVKAVVTQFASDQHCEVYDASSMFNVMRGDALKVDTALVLLSQRSQKHPNVLHFVQMSEYNVEALLAADILLQVRDVFEGLSDAIAVGQHLLHAFCVFQGATIKMHDVRDAVVLRAVLTQIETDAECMICLEDLCNLQTTLPFACGHPICRGCFEQNRLRECAKCRTVSPWKAQRYVHIDEATKREAHARGRVYVRDAPATVRSGTGPDFLP